MGENTSKAKLEGFLIDVRTVSEENLVVEVDASKISWNEYRALISDLQDILTGIDEEYSARSWLMKGRSLKASYRRVNAKDRERRLRFMPFPSRFATTLKNLRAYVYELVADYCLVLESVGNRNVYLLPKHLAPFFVEAVEKINREVIEPLRRDVEKFRQSHEYLSIQQCLYQHGVNPSALKVAAYHLRNYVVDVLPIDFGYSIGADEAYAKMERAEAIKGLEILRKQIERKYREYALNAVSNVASRIMAIVEGLEAKGKKVRNAKEKVEKLISICESLGLREISEKTLKPLKQICTAKPYQRPKLAEELFGTKSLMAGVGEDLKKLLENPSVLGGNMPKTLYCNSFEVSRSKEAFILIFRFESPDGYRETVYITLNPSGVAILKEMLTKEIEEYIKEHGELPAGNWKVQNSEGDCNKKHSYLS